MHFFCTRYQQRYAGTYEPHVYAMEIDGNGRLITQHNLNFDGCYDWGEKKITFITSHNTSEFYVQANTWECDGTFQVEDVLLEICEVPLPGVTDLGLSGRGVCGGHAT